MESLVERRKKIKEEKKNSRKDPPIMQNQILVDKTCPLEEALEKGSKTRMDKANAEPLEIVDSLEFSDGKNTLTIRFSKRHNRMYRVQVLLNGESEIRPVTYTGASTGYAFWNLLKGALRK